MKVAQTVLQHIGLDFFEIWEFFFKITNFYNFGNNSIIRFYNGISARSDDYMKLNRSPARQLSILHSSHKL